MTEHKNYKKMTKIFNKRLTRYHKETIKTGKPTLDYFIAQLQFAQDLLMLKSDKTTVDKAGITHCAAAIDEYKQYKTCVNKYFMVKEDKIIPIENKTEQEAKEAYLQEKLQHWDNFWEIAKRSFMILEGLSDD